jgi:hypothetical protein
MPRPGVGPPSWCVFEWAAAVGSRGACEYADDIGMYEGDGWMGLRGGCCSGGIELLPFGADDTGV